MANLHLISRCRCFCDPSWSVPMEESSITIRYEEAAKSPRRPSD